MGYLIAAGGPGWLCAAALKQYMNKTFTSGQIPPHLEGAFAIDTGNGQLEMVGIQNADDYQHYVRTYRSAHAYRKL